MPALALIDCERLRWLPPVPLPVFLLWPLAWSCLGLASILDRTHPTEAERLRTGLAMFRELRGLSIDVELAERRALRVWIR